MKIKTIMLMALLSVGSLAYAQEAGEKKQEGNKGYIYGSPQPAVEAAERTRPSVSLNVVGGVKKLDDWIKKNLW